ncbi:MAG: NAD-dependent epimerase/dehydratase family protein [Salinivirgaceae bacterium]
MNAKQTVLIAGATGFVGRELVTHLITSGYEVKILTRNVVQAKKIFPKDVIILLWPNEKESRVLPATYSCNVVVNLAGANIGNLRWTHNNKHQILNSRIQSVDALFQIVNQLPELPSVWIQASAIGYYGANTLTPTNESGIQGKGFLASVVNQWELALESKSLGEVRKVYLRFGIVLSPKGGFLKQMKDAFNF